VTGVQTCALPIWVRNKKIKSNVETGFLITLLTIIFLGAFVGLLIYIKEMM
jgi:hypothetical protein